MATRERQAGYHCDGYHQGCRMYGPQSAVGATDRWELRGSARPSLPSHPVVFPIQQGKGFITQWNVDRWTVEVASSLRRAMKFPRPTNFTPSCLPQILLKCKCNPGGETSVNIGPTFSNLMLIPIYAFGLLSVKRPQREVIQAWQSVRVRKMDILHCEVKMFRSCFFLCSAKWPSLSFVQTFPEQID